MPCAQAWDGKAVRIPAVPGGGANKLPCIHVADLVQTVRPSDLVHRQCYAVIRMIEQLPTRPAVTHSSLIGGAFR